MDSFYTDAHRALQDRFDTRRLADRLQDVIVSDHFSEPYRRIVERAPFFWIATADQSGWPEVSYKGGQPGFVRVLPDERTIAFPAYDGNGMFRSLGNLVDNPRVGLLFIDFEKPKRLRVRGIASVLEDAASLATFPGAQLVVQVVTEQVFFNCPRYVHEMHMVELSSFAPCEGYEPPEPEWKARPDFKPYLPG